MTCGMSASSTMSSLARPAASDSLIPVSLISDTNQRGSSSVVWQRCWMTLNLSVGIGCRVDASPLSGMNVPLKALLPFIPCSRITRLMMALTKPKTRFTVLIVIPCSTHQSRNCAASEEEKEAIGLLPIAFATYSALRRAVLLKAVLSFPLIER